MYVFCEWFSDPTAVSDVRVNGYTETSLTLSWQQRDVQQSGYSYLLAFTHPNGTINQKTVNITTAQLLSLQSASPYNISIITQTADGTKSDPQFLTACTSKQLHCMTTQYCVYVLATYRVITSAQQSVVCLFSRAISSFQCGKGRPECFCCKAELVPSSGVPRWVFLPSVSVQLHRKQ